MDDAQEFLHRDQLGSVRAITDATGSLAKQSVFKPFGTVTDWTLSASLEPETKGFIGERYDADAGLQYLNARYYDPELGIFIQPDWFEVTEAGVGTNRYGYSFNDPVNLRDPGGNSTDPNEDVEEDNQQSRWERFRSWWREQAEIGRQRRTVENLTGESATRDAITGQFNSAGADFTFDGDDVFWSFEVAVLEKGGAYSGAASVSRPSNRASVGGPVSKVNGRFPVNHRWAGKTHPSGIKFDKAGYPIFTQHARASVSIRDLTGRYRIDARKANQAAGFSRTPKGYTWHHHQDTITMQLVPTAIHREVRHTGGAAILRWLIR